MKLSYLHTYLFMAVHRHCVSHLEFDAEDPAMNLTWWGRLLHIHIDRFPSLRRALLWIL